jgi:hypothetical protein
MPLSLIDLFVTDKTLTTLTQVTGLLEDLKGFNRHDYPHPSLIDNRIYRFGIEESFYVKRREKVWLE